MANAYSTPPFTDKELAHEEWRVIPGYGGLYEASSLGRISRVYDGERRILGTWETTTGYQVVNLTPRFGSKRKRKAHALVAEAFFGPRPDGHHVNHIDLNRANNRVSNLEWVTPAQNARHAVAARKALGIERVCRSERRGCSKITATIAREILFRRCSGESVGMIASALGVGESLVYGVSSGSSWRDVYDEFTANPSNLAALRASRWVRHVHAQSANAGLSPDDIRTIRRRHASGETQASLRREYGIGEDRMRHIIHRRSWRWVTDEAA